MDSIISCLDGSFLEYLPIVQGVWDSVPVQIALEEDKDIFGQDSLLSPLIMSEQGEKRVEEAILAGALQMKGR
jgi:hypothetical protein